MPYKDLIKRNACQLSYYYRNRDKVLAKQIEYNKKNKDVINAIKRENYKRLDNKERLRNVKLQTEYQEFLILLKSKPCTDCKQCYPSYVMQFDHVPDLGIKEFEISNGANHPIDKVILELTKCELVCANCHYYRTTQRHGKRVTSLTKFEEYVRLKRQTCESCKDCHTQFPWQMMHFDHVPERGPKLFSLSRIRGKTFYEIDIEMAKCDLVCANCHVKRTFDREQGIYNKRV